MQKLFLLVLSCFLIGINPMGIEAQSVDSIPLQLGGSLSCQQSRSHWPVNMAMDSGKNKFVICTENYNGQGGLEIVIKLEKLDPTATQVLYSIPINVGSFANSDIAVDGNGTAFVLHGNGITRVSPDGSVVELGWTSVNLSEGASISVDSLGNIFVSGRLNNDAAIVKVRPDGSTLFVQTLGGSGFDIANGAAFGPNETVVVTGRTDSTDFPVLNALQPSSSGGSDAFLARLNANNGTVLSSTYLGGSGFDEGRGLAVGSSGTIVIVGETDSPNFPILNASQAGAGGYRDGFISKFNSIGSLLTYSTYLGGDAHDSAAGVALDGGENATVTGFTNSTNFPLFRSRVTVLEGNWQAFLTKLTSNGSSYLFSTYQSGGINNFHNGFDVIDDSAGGLFLSVTSHSYQGGGHSNTAVLRFSRYQSQLLYDPSKPFKPNPLIKIQLQDLAGINQSSSGIPVSSLHVSPSGNSSTVLKTLGGSFTFDANLKFAGSTPGGYKYQLDRTGLGAGNYDLVFTVANETAWRTVPFSLK